ncbi:hypothetical protein CMUS01_04104 [Colletotrichum musicola]|uniref:Uncharacterized protein n=1 Tax=Colletotrichum musicola TaxID=2175873 RepID=A0A8H6NP48_9PEZI|nr:hypothetical protein CMUS01_04104 [Colletotrichum musicola]
MKTEGPATAATHGDTQHFSSLDARRFRPSLTAHRSYRRDGVSKTPLQCFTGAEPDAAPIANERMTLTNLLSYRQAAKMHATSLLPIGNDPLPIANRPIHVRALGHGYTVYYGVPKPPPLAWNGRVGTEMPLNLLRTLGSSVSHLLVSSTTRTFGRPLVQGADISGRMSANQAVERHRRVPLKRNPMLALPTLQPASRPPAIQGRMARQLLQPTLSDASNGEESVYLLGAVVTRFRHQLQGSLHPRRLRPVHLLRTHLLQGPQVTSKGLPGKVGKNLGEASLIAVDDGPSISYAVGKVREAGPQARRPDASLARRSATEEPKTLYSTNSPAAPELQEFELKVLGNCTPCKANGYLRHLGPAVSQAGTTNGAECLCTTWALRRHGSDGEVALGLWHLQWCGRLERFTAATAQIVERLQNGSSAQALVEECEHEQREVDGDEAFDMPRDSAAGVQAGSAVRCGQARCPSGAQLPQPWLFRTGSSAIAVVKRAQGRMAAFSRKGHEVLGGAVAALDWTGVAPSLPGTPVRDWTNC